MRDQYETPTDGFNDFDHWWKYVIQKQPSQAIIDVLMLPQVKKEFVHKWNEMVKEEL